MDEGVADRLWEIADDNTLDDFSRASALTVLGSPIVTADENQLQWLREKAFSKTFDQQPEAFEGLLLRKGISESEFPNAAAFLGCTYLDGRFELKEPNHVTTWQAYMLAHLYRMEPNRTCGVITSILEHSPAESVHQITCI